MTREAKTMLEQLRGMVARGWCHPENSHKEFDGDLAEAIVEEVEREFQSQYRAGASAQRERDKGICKVEGCYECAEMIDRSAPIEGEKV